MSMDSVDGAAGQFISSSLSFLSCSGEETGHMQQRQSRLHSVENRACGDCAATVIPPSEISEVKSNKA